MNLVRLGTVSLFTLTASVDEAAADCLTSCVLAETLELLEFPVLVLEKPIEEVADDAVDSCEEFDGLFRLLGIVVRSVEDASMPCKMY